MAETTKTKYVVLREVELGDPITDGHRLFVTDGVPVEVSSADQACRRAAENGGGAGFYATVPDRSWDPVEYEIEQKPQARRKKIQETLDV